MRPKVLSISKFTHLLLAVVLLVPLLLVDISTVSAQTTYTVGLPCRLKSGKNLSTINATSSHVVSGIADYKSLDLQPGDECEGTDIIASNTGTINYKTYDYNCTQLGIGVVKNSEIAITSSDGTVTTYLHYVLGTEKYQNGQTVTAGAVIGTIGRQGCASGNHIHFNTKRNNLNLYRANASAYAGSTDLWQFGELVKNTNEYGFITSGNWIILNPSDVTGDRLADIVAFNKVTTEVKVTRSTGTSFHSSETNGEAAIGGYESWNTNSTYLPSEWKLLPLADVTGDGLADLIAFNTTTSQLKVTRSTGSSFHELIVDGNSASDGSEIWNTKSYYLGWKLLKPADVDRDGDADIIAYNPTTTALNVTRSQRTSFHQSETDGEIATGGSEVWNSKSYFASDWTLLSPADVNGDSRADIVAYQPSSRAIRVALSNGTYFGASTGGSIVWNADSKYDPVNWTLLPLANVNERRLSTSQVLKADLIAFNNFTYAVDVTRSTGSSFHDTNTDGQNATGGYKQWNTNTQYAWDWTLLSPADVNGDELVDLIAIKTGGENIGQINVTTSTGTSFHSTETIGDYAEGGSTIWNMDSKYR